ncbi:unnamed protein product, partial [Larinioides sclopetarius]
MYNPIVVMTIIKIKRKRLSCWFIILSISLERSATYLNVSFFYKFCANFFLHNWKRPRRRKRKNYGIW